MSTDPPPIDLREDAAALIGEVGRCSQQAARYRALATSVAEPAFDRAIAIGSAIRRADRSGRSEAIADAVAELRSLLRQCEEGIESVRASGSYRALAAAYAADDVGRATELAATVFTGVTAKNVEVAVHWPVPIRGKRSEEHFVSPERCVATISAAIEHGIIAPSEAPPVGGDETIRPVQLTTDPDASESPITLCFVPKPSAAMMGRVPNSDAILWYAKRLTAELSVSAAYSVTDEWWEIRPAAYADYLNILKRALCEAGLSLTIRPKED